MPVPIAHLGPMTTPIRRRWRLFRRGAWYALAALLVVLAIGNGIGSQLLPLAERNPERIADWLSARAQRPVAFDGVETEWTRRGPLLRLDNLRVGDAANPVHLGDAEILVAQYAGLLPGRSFTELRVRGLDLTLQRDAAGLWSVRGLPGQQAQGDPLATLERLGELQVSDARLRVLSPELGLDVAVPRVELRMRVVGDRVRGGAKAWLRTGGTPLSAALDFNRRSGDGRAYVGSRQADLAEFGDMLRIAGIVPVSGRGRVQAWASLAARRVVGLHAAMALEDVVLRGTASRPGQVAPTQALGIVSMDARWTGSAGQWQAAASRLRIGRGAGEQVLDGIAVDGGQRFGMRATRIDAAPLLATAALSDALPPATRAWLLAARPGAIVHDLDVRGARGGALRTQAGLQGLHFAAVGDAPGLRGVDARLQGDANALHLSFDGETAATLDWPRGFRAAHAMALDGDVIAWREGKAWQLRTPGLAIKGDQLSLAIRGGLDFTGDGTRPRVDLAVDIGDAPLLTAKQFWLQHRMRKPTIDWLDAALQGGTLRDVHAVVAGDLDDWPFRAEGGKAGAGVFRVDARLVDAMLKFHPEWPSADAVNGNLRFEGSGFSVDGRARIGGMRVDAFSGGIDDFRRAELRVAAATTGDAADLLGMLRQSPLQKRHGETLRNLHVAGPARADFALFRPFHKDAAMRLGGSVELRGASVRERRWNLAFDNVRGTATYDHAGFVASDLQVRHEGELGALSLRAGPHVRDPRQVFEAELQASVGIDALLDKAGTLDWLKPYLEGRSPWTVAVQVPRGAAAQGLPSRLQLRSSLVGTAINLPDPVRKPAAQALAASVDVSLPLQRGEVGVVLGNLLALRSRSDDRQTGMRIRFGGGAAEAPPATGLIVAGRVDRLDALDWIGVIKEVRGNAGSGRGMPLRRVEVEARQLRLLGSSFAESRVLVVPAPRGIAIQVQGASLAGSLLVPDQEGATIAGRFDRLYWRMPRRASGAAAPVAAVAAATVVASSPVDPSRIPPMLFEVGDLRIGDASLGTARFRSTPTAAGLRLDEFAARSARQAMVANGVWSGRGAQARTQLALDVQSQDIGSLLAGLGLGGQVAGGRGALGLDAAWRGGPEALDPNSVQATLVLDARDGRLLELEPGAGRVLGLLGVAQLPRRLTLDFRDFFEKGFAFDSIKGDVRLSGGSARTDNLAIKGPAADIHVRGSADLRTQQFDQTVEVLPKSGGLLTAVGALAGGPVGAAVGAIANAVLEKPLQGLGARTYRVSGPWQSPKVDVSTRSPQVTRKAPREEPPG